MYLSTKWTTQGSEENNRIRKMYEFFVFSLTAASGTKPLGASKRHKSKPNLYNKHRREAAYGDQEELTSSTSTSCCPPGQQAKTWRAPRRQISVVMALANPW